MDLNDIIAAPATPPGEGGVAIVRLSGTGCLELSRSFFKSNRSTFQPVSHVLYHGYFHDQQSVLLDEVMFVFMRGPRSFTAEDVVEIHCHAGQSVVSSILNAFLRAGARLALPGEFTYRAFVNGRIDLSQAEAVVDLIHSRSVTAQSLALSHLGGQLSRELYLKRRIILDTLALIEAWLDFPEEDLPDEELSSVCQRVSEVVSSLQNMVDSYNTGRLYSEGVSLVLLGKPNVGKSSLMNSLLGEERAIVTEIQGTTRDTLEEGLVINGLPVRLIDTAGIRESCDPIEREGVARAKARIASADLVLLLVDGSRPLDDEDLAALEVVRNSLYLLVVTKADLPRRSELPETNACCSVPISTKTGSGLDALRQAIYSALVANEHRTDNSVLLTSQRHKEAALLTILGLNRFLGAAEQRLSLEFLANDLRDALSALGSITGETTPDDVLGEIFSRFCIGK